MGSKLGILALLLAPLLCVDVVRGFEWDNSRKNSVYACAGSNMVFPWHYKVSEAETVVSINWIHDGAQSSTIMAMMVHNHFLPTSGYRGRVRHVTNAGLILKGLSAEESGNYTVQVNVLTGGKYQSFRQTVYLHVMEGLMLEGDLKADQDPEARWDEDSQSWLIRLTCGTFTFPGPPLLDVNWRTPNKEKKTSSGYESGHFYLSLASPVKGGVYTCSIPKSRLRDLCYKEHGGNDSVALSATVTVDEIKARLSMLEANQKKVNEQHVHDIQSVEQTHVQDMQNMTDVMDNLEELTDQVHSVQQSLKDRVASVNKTLTDFITGGDCLYGQHTVLDDPWRSTATKDVSGSLKCDKKLKPGWYRFLLNGTNAVMPTTCVPTNHCTTHAPYWLDLQGKTLPVPGRLTEGRTCAHWSSKCCRWESPVTVMNCGSFFIYKLKPYNYCSLAFCAEAQL